MFDDAHTALDLALRLWRSRLAHARGNAQASHEVTKDRIPFGRLVFHLQKDAFHAIGECGFGQTAKVLERLHHAADHRRGVTALDKGDEAHARVREDSSKAIQFVILPVFLVVKFAPIVLHLLSWLGFVAQYRIMSRFGGT